VDERAHHAGRGVLQEPARGLAFDPHRTGRQCADCRGGVVSAKLGDLMWHVKYML
jgi:hypothetical protein